MNQSIPKQKSPKLLLRLTIMVGAVVAVALLGLLFQLGVIPLGHSNATTLHPPLIRSEPEQSSSAPVNGGTARSWEGVEPAFNYFADIDREKLADSLVQLHAPYQRQPRPAGMDDDVYAICDLLVNDEPSAKELCRLTPEQTGPIVDAGFVKDGEYLVTLGDKLIVWRATTGEKVREHKVPLSEARQLLLGNDPTTAVIANDRTLVKCSLVDGKIQSQANIDPGIARACMAYENGCVAVCTSDMSCLYLSADLKKGTKLSNATLSAADLAIAPNNRMVMFLVNNKPARWLVDESSVEEMLCDSENLDGATLIANDQFEFLFVDSTLYCYNGRELIYPVPLSSIPLAHRIHADVLQFFSTQTGAENTMLLIAKEKVGESPGVRAIDITPKSGSKPTLISQDPKVKVFASRVGLRLALQESDGFRVIERRSWVSNDGSMWPIHMLQLFWEGRFEQLDLVGNYVRQHRRLPCNETAEQIYRILTGRLGDLWASMEDSKENQDLLKKAELWREGKSVLALSASAVRHMGIGLRARGTDVANTVTDEGWKIFYERNRQAIKDLSAIPADVQLPAVAYEMKLDLHKNGGGGLDMGDKILTEYVTNFPYETVGHQVACQWSLPRWGGQDGQCGAYLDAMAKIYPPQYAEEIYARVACRVQTDARELEPGEFGVDPSRTTVALNSLAKKEWLSRNDMERALGFHYALGLTNEAVSMATRHFREHVTVGEEGYMKGAYIVIRDIQSR